MCIRDSSFVGQENVPRFETQKELQFRLTSSETNAKQGMGGVLVANATAGQVNYSAIGVLETSQETITATKNAQIAVTSESQTTTIVDTGSAYTNTVDSIYTSTYVAPVEVVVVPQPPIICFPEPQPPAPLPEVVLPTICDPIVGVVAVQTPTDEETSVVEDPGGGDKGGDLPVTEIPDTTNLGVGKPGDDVLPATDVVEYGGGNTVYDDGSEENENEDWGVDPVDLSPTGGGYTAEVDDVFGTGNIYTTPTVSVADSGDDTGGGSTDGGGKIVCTEMYRQTQLDDWKTAMKIWGFHTKTHLTPFHQRGYHFLFMPWVKGMRKSTSLTKSGSWLAQRRTQHLKYLLSRDVYSKYSKDTDFSRLGIKQNEKDDFVGRIWCTVWHPITFITGKILSLLNKKDL